MITRFDTLLETQNVMADFMSRKPVSESLVSEAEMEETQVLFIEDELIDAQTIVGEIKSDPVLSQVLHYTLNGWPEKVNNVDLQPFFAKRWELSVADNVLLWNDRVVIPMSLRVILLNELHSEHTGAVRMKRIARRYFWWPKIDEAIEETTKQCMVCQEQARKPTKSYATWSWPSGPWRRLHLDFAGPFLGKMFLIVVDAYSKYLEVIPMSTATSAGTIKSLRRLFATFGLPTHIVTDNGSQFTSAEFKSFLRANGIAHTCSAPGHPETNGLAERYVGHFKAKMKLMGTNDDLDTRLQRFLLTYRSTPSSNGKSPAEMLMNRQPRLRYDTLKSKPNAGVQSFNQNMHLTPEYKPGDAVFVWSFRKSDPNWIPGVVLSLCSPMNYTVQIDDVVWKRHRNQLRPRSVPLTQFAERTGPAVHPTQPSRHDMVPPPPNTRKPESPQDATVDQQATQSLPELALQQQQEQQQQQQQEQQQQ
eukprot:scpid79697/ scgid33944/ Uncharacterized protein K02A2.6